MWSAKFPRRLKQSLANIGLEPSTVLSHHIAVARGSFAALDRWTTNDRFEVSLIEADERGKRMASDMAIGAIAAATGAAAMSAASLVGPHPFPLIRGGGLFLLVVGLSIMVAAVAPRRLWVFLIGGAMVASASVMLTAVRLAAPLGRPIAFQIDSLGAAVLIEVIAIGRISSRLRAASERRRILSILLVVGAHFFLMGPAFGPLVVLLGLLTVANAASGLRAAATSWFAFWLIDGALKAAFGGIMFWYAPRITWW